MKCLEKIVLCKLMSFVQPQLDPLQFAYRSHRGVDDAIATLLHRLLSHLDTPGHTARVLFADFSSAFNTIQRHVMVEKLLQMHVPTSIVRWILDFLSNRPQSVRAAGALSPSIVTNTGAPQGCVLSPFLYIIYTNDCRCTGPNSFCIKFADDSAVVGLLSDDQSFQSYLEEIDRFRGWCEDHFLELNVTKTKEMVLGSHRHSPPDPVSLNNHAVEIVDNFKYLGLTLDDRLSFKSHVVATQKKCQQRLYILRRLASFNLQPKLLLNLYRSIIEPVLTYCNVIFWPSISETEKKKLLKVTKIAAKLVGLPVPSLSALCDKSLLRKACAVADDTSHPLQSEFVRLPSSRRYRTLRCSRIRLRNSFVPSAVRALNSARQ